MIRCEECRHRSGVGFRDLAACELDFMTGFKKAHEVAWTGELLIREGEPSELVGVLYSGMATKSRTLATGKRQILSLLLPGDLIGLECVYGGTSSHSVEAVTDITYCRFDARRWSELLNVGTLASRICELQIYDQRHLEDRFTAVSAGSARRAVAHFVAETYDRLKRRRLIRGLSFILPLTNVQFADAVGLTTVHLHRVLRRMQEEKVFTHNQRRIVIEDLERLRELACSPTVLDEQRPLI